MRGAEGGSDWSTVSERRGSEVEIEPELCHVGPCGHKLRGQEKIYLRVTERGVTEAQRRKGLKDSMPPCSTGTGHG